MKRFAGFVAAAIILGLGAYAPADAATPLPTVPIGVCGQEVPAKTIGVLQNDLACEGVSSSAVLTNEKAVLQLNGHTIDADEFGVFALGNQTTIQGPGDIHGADSVAIYHGNNTGTVKVSVTGDVNLHDNEYGIVLGQGNKTTLTLNNVSIVDNNAGAIADCTKLTIKADALTVTGNADGICGASIQLKNSSVSDNSGVGIFNWYGKVRLDNTTVTGNGGNVNVPAPADIVSYRKPHLFNSTCDHSLRLRHFPVLWHFPGVYPTWGVCTGD
jgi:hypothetical protein